MSIFQEIKEYVTARNVAEHYGLKVGRNGLACCPFHNDHHPSMKIDQFYYCFACGAKGDAINYVADTFEISQYDAACRIIEDFNLPISINQIPDKEKEMEYQRQQEEKRKITQIKEQFEQWTNKSADIVRNCLKEIDEVKRLVGNIPIDTISDTEDYAYLVNQEPILEYWLDILCMGTMKERHELFMHSRKKVKKLAEETGRCRQRILERNRKYYGCGA